MKKIILILALLSLGVSKAQVVGGYLPLNSTKSATMGGLRVNGTSTFTGNALFSSSVGIGGLPTSSLSLFRVVKGTSTIDLGAPGSSLSAIWLNASNPSGSNYSLYEDASNTFLNAKSGQSIFLSVNASNIARVTSSGLISLGTFSATGASTITGALTAQSTMSLGSANLTGGNTGTVAVLSDVVFPITFQHGSYNPSDGLTIYYGNNGGATPLTNASFGRVYAQRNLTLIGYDYNISVLGTAGSAETSTISLRIDNTTNVTLNSSATHSAASGFTEYHSSALNSDINSGSYFNIQWVTPTWVTNPTSVVQSVTLWFVRRS